ncbi:hypothetical protein [Bowmanella yangjiangensis]|uniref:Uncharacterized protein n=1 Tax=Bowmanella yangjiangensis TaxID=2811230 RepID=A0ABS3CV85_9ALTE|nr:hypothetical protein [Bowmanella yangjiangensis]MBN7820515.1 hypothetical protein [Bowmanella yangjiangensis]
MKHQITFDTKEIEISYASVDAMHRNMAALVEQFKIRKQRPPQMFLHELSILETLLAKFNSRL